MEEKNLYGGGLPADAPPLTGSARTHVRRARRRNHCHQPPLTGSATGGARTHVRRARRREPLPSYYCTGHICAQSVRARHAQAHRWVFRFPFQFFFSSLKSEYLKLTNNRFWLKYCCLIATKIFYNLFATDIINLCRLIKIDQNCQSSEKTIKHYWFC